MEYDIRYQVLDYDSYHEVLKEILENKDNKYEVQKHHPIGYSACGFPIEHYSIGSGKYQIVYMGGAHGNEIIGVDFILQFMRNLALGNGVFQDFPEQLFQIHFFPLQNPEGFFITTYAIKEVIKGQKKEAFCKNYYLNYRRANVEISSLTKILYHFYQLGNFSFSFDTMKQMFWDECYGQDLDVNGFFFFLSKYFKNIDRFIVQEFWKKYIGQEKILFPFEFQKSFSSVNVDCIPDLTPMHSSLKTNLRHMFQNSSFSNFMLGNFVATSLGINLNENNEPYFQQLKELIRQGKKISVSPIYGNYPKNIASPFGLPSADMNCFAYACENTAILNFLSQHEEEIYAFMNCHGTGGMLFFNPYYDKDSQRKHDFSFYINNRIATEYLKAIQKSYQKNGIQDFYKGMGYPTCVTGLGDVMRMQYPASFLLELSKAGGNPLGAYVQPNYDLTMIVNMEASMSLLQTILEVQHLYGKTYQKRYNEFGKVAYEEHERIRKI